MVPILRDFQELLLSAGLLVLALGCGAQAQTCYTGPEIDAPTAKAVDSDLNGTDSARFSRIVTQRGAAGVGLRVRRTGTDLLHRSGNRCAHGQGGRIRVTTVFQYVGPGRRGRPAGERDARNCREFWRHRTGRSVEQDVLCPGTAVGDADFRA